MSSESTIEQQFVRWCRKHNLPCLKLAIVNRRGWPDRTVLLGRGRTAFIEFKRPDGKGELSAQQRATIDQLTGLGYTVGVAESLSEAVAIVQRANV